MRPQHACCAEFRYFHEVDCAHAHVKLDALCHLVGREANLGQLGKPFLAPSQCVAKFLIYECAGIVEQNGINAEHAQILHRCHCLQQFACNGHDVAAKGNTMLDLFLERVEVDRTGECVFGLGCLYEFNQCLGHCHCLLGAAVDVDFHLRQIEALEQGFEVGVGVNRKSE